jgi:hypothetical protein
MDCFADMSPEYQTKYKKAYKIRLGIIFGLLTLMISPLIIGFLMGAFGLGDDYPFLDPLGLFLWTYSPVVFVLFLIVVCSMGRFNAKYYTIGTTAALQLVPNTRSYHMGSSPNAATLKPTPYQPNHANSQKVVIETMQSTYRPNDPITSNPVKSTEEKTCPQCLYRVSLTNPVCPNCLFRFNQKIDDDY